MKSRTVIGEGLKWRQSKNICYSCKRAGCLSSEGPPHKELFIQTSDLTSPVSSLTLIGTVHNDSRSAAPLAQLLGQLQPDQLTVEISPDAVTYRQTHGVLLLRKLGMILEHLVGSVPPQRLLDDHPGIVAIRNLLGLPYEFRAASLYAEEKGIKLHAIDQADLTLARLRPVEERLISLHHLKRIVLSPWGVPPSDEHRYELARELLSSPDGKLRGAFLKGCRGEEGVGPRDRHLGEQIRTLAQAQPGHLVHIGGWVHLVDDPGNETLYSLLKDLQPRCLLLDPDHPLIP